MKKLLYHQKFFKTKNFCKNLHATVSVSFIISSWVHEWRYAEIYQNWSMHYNEWEKRFFKQKNYAGICTLQFRYLSPYRHGCTNDDMMKSTKTEACNLKNGRNVFKRRFMQGSARYNFDIIHHIVMGARMTICWNLPKLKHAI